MENLKMLQHDSMSETTTTDAERFLPQEMLGIIALEHWHRYLFAAQFTQGKVVLDLACGDGYGSDYIAMNAQRVFGIDISESTIRRATEKYRRANLEFKLGSCSEIPLADGSVDVVVSFETIEHHDAHVAMLSEFRRVLKPGGVLIISSPDKQEYSDKLGYQNPFHVKELLREEFQSLLQERFRNVRLLGQRVMFGSVILPEEDKAAVTRYVMNEGRPSDGPGLEAVYWIGLASDKKLPNAIAGVLDNKVLLAEVSQKLGRNRALAEFIRALATPDSAVLKEALTDDWYRGNNADVFKAGIDTYAHWLEFGSREGRLPSGNVPGLVDALVSERLKILQSRLYDALDAGTSTQRELMEALRDREEQFTAQMSSLRANVDEAHEELRTKDQAFLQTLREREEQFTAQMSSLRANVDEAHEELRAKDLAFLQILRERDAQFADQLQSLQDEAGSARESNREAAQRQLQTQEEEARLRELEWSARLNVANEQREQLLLQLESVRAEAQLKLDAQREAFEQREGTLQSRLKEVTGQVDAIRRAADADTTGLRFEMHKLRLRTRYEVDAMLRGAVKEREEFSAQFTSLRAEADSARENDRQLAQRQLEARAEEARARESQLNSQFESLLETAQRERDLERQAAQMHRDALTQQLGDQTAESLRREQQLQERLEVQAAQSLRREQQLQEKIDALATGSLRREQQLQEQIDARAEESLRREQQLQERLDFTRSQIKEKDLAFLVTLRQREEDFAAHLTSMRADAVRAREAEGQLVRQQQQSTLRDFRRREMELGRVIAELKEHLWEFENSRLWRLRSVFMPAKSGVLLAAPNPADIDTADNFGDLDMMQSISTWGQPAPTSLSNLLTHDDQDFVALAYRAILGRPADSIGLAHYLDMLRRGVGKLDIVWILRMSDEGRAYKSKLIGLLPALMYLRWRRLPLLAHFWRLRDLSRNLLRQMKLARAEIVELRHKYASSQSELQNFVEFDPESYQSINDDVATAAINPYEHYIRFGYRENRQTRRPKTHTSIALACDWLGSGRAPELPSIQPPVDIIIPIFNGYDFLGPLFDTVAANTRDPYRLIVIDDCSTDSRIPEFLRELSERNPGIVLLRNQTNQGFIGSVNLGMEKVSSEIFVLLNSDTEVPPRWLERLIHPLQISESVATVTPFSNSATICSFPNSPGDNPLYLDLSVNQIDEAFAEVGSSAQPIEVPTGVGFCMAMRKSVVDKIGCFDPIYGRGYAEENDWCMRASAAGYRHVLAVNLFVYHKHGGSFPSEERARLIKNNLSTLFNRYPNYSELVQAHIHADSAKAIRDLVKLRLHSEASGGATVIIDHDLGGGANAFRSGLIRAVDRLGGSTIVVVHDAQQRGRVLMLAHGPDGETRFSFPSVEAIGEFLESVSVSEFVYNNLVGSPDPLKVVRALRMQVGARSVPFRIMVHDFYPLCPSYTLIDKDGSYCGVPEDLGTCAACMRGYSKDLLPHGPTKMDIREWRSEWRELMELATEIRCFSTSSRDIFIRAYPDLANRCTVVPHAVDFKPAKLPTIRRDARLHIGVVGGINYCKGRAVIESLVRHFEDRGLEHRVSVIGQVDVPVRGINVTGKYEVAHLPEIIENLGINVILIPSIWPETFSYVTSEMVLLGMPVACFNIGAPPERIRSYEKGIVLEGSDPETILKGLLDLCSAERSSDVGLTA